MVVFTLGASMWVLSRSSARRILVAGVDAVSSDYVAHKGRRLEVTDFGSYPAAMTEMGTAGSLGGGLLSSRRRRRFVGCTSEIELFWAAHDSAEPPCSMLHLHRPGGVGKARLLNGLAGRPLTQARAYPTTCAARVGLPTRSTCSVP
jgi:hypothetical protein